MDVNGTIAPNCCKPFPDSIARSEAIAFTLGDAIYFGLGVRTQINIPARRFNDLWVYNPDTDGWAELEDDPFMGGKRFAAVAFTIGGKAYVGTGIDSNGDFKNDFYVFDPTKPPTEKWSEIEGIQMDNHVYGAVAFSIEGYGYVGLGRGKIHGQGPIQDFDDFWKFDTMTQNWTRLNADPFPGGARNGAISFVIDGKAYVGSGAESSDPLLPEQFYQDFWQFDPSKEEGDCWSKRAVFIGGGRREAIGFSIGQKGYLVGGMMRKGNSIETFNDIWQYTPEDP